VKAVPAKSTLALHAKETYEAHKNLRTLRKDYAEMREHSQVVIAKAKSDIASAKADLADALSDLLFAKAHYIKVKNANKR
jgi:hypothetical protein